MLFNLYVFVDFPVFFLQFISSFIPLWIEKILDMISSCLILFILVLWPNIWSILENVHVSLRRMYSLLLLDEMYCIHLLIPVDLTSLLIFCLDDLSIDISEVLNSPTNIVLLSIAPFRSVHVCFIYLSAFLISVTWIQFNTLKNEKWKKDVIWNIQCSMTKSFSSTVNSELSKERLKRLSKRQHQKPCL